MDYLILKCDYIYIESIKWWLKKIFFFRKLGSGGYCFKILIFIIFLKMLYLVYIKIRGKIISKKNNIFIIVIG